MNIYAEIIMNMAHFGVKSEIKPENTQTAHQMATVKWMNIYDETILNMAHQEIELDIKLRSDNTKN